MARRFNLQPWRAERREKHRKQFVAVTAILAIASFALFYGYGYLKKKYIESQQQAIVILKQNIDKYKYAEEEVEKVKELNKELTREIEEIQKMQARRSLSVKILNHIALNTEEKVFLNELSLKDCDIKLVGVAENEPSVSNFIRKMQSFSETKDVNLISMKKLASTKRYEVLGETEVRDFELNIAVKDCEVPKNRRR